ncbi:uncharacterized protein METZ01_LOCUS36174 [marine metagenome]|uniref:Uncharacterized protein n=1 Tax=marine metagenome TaxID=408172 RepID=A0A381QW05_9ZZZZ
MPIFKIDFITSLACKDPAIPARVVIIPSDSQFNSSFGDLGIKHLKHGVFLLKSKLNTCPSNLFIAEETNIFLFFIQ